MERIEKPYTFFRIGAGIDATTIYIAGRGTLVTRPFGREKLDFFAGWMIGIREYRRTQLQQEDLMLGTQTLTHDFSSPRAGSII